ncbi:MAG: hypothetical protein ACREP5_01450 [Candidatus Binatia bacterium]
MSEALKKCMICAKPSPELKGGICNPCQDRIRREAMGEQAGIADRAEREISRQGIASSKK